MGVYVRDLLLGLVSQKLLYYMVKFSCFLCNYYSPMENVYFGWADLDASGSKNIFYDTGNLKVIVRKEL